MNLNKRQMLALLAAMLPLGSYAQSQLRSKPVKVITPFAAGTGPDNVMRIVAEKLGKIWSTPVLIENRPGGNSWIAADAAKRSPADGSSLFLADASTMTMQPNFFRKMPFDPAKDFAAVAPLFRNNYFVVVPVQSKWKDMRDMAAAARASKGETTFGTSGIGGMLHVQSAILAQALGAPMTHIPMKEATQVYLSLSRGDIDWAYGTGSTVGPLYKANKVRLLCLAAPQRHPSFKEVPTIVEAGGPALEAQSWTALFAPAGTPKSVIDQMNADINRVMMEADVRERLEAVTFLPWTSTAAELTKVITEETAQFGEVAKSLKLSLD